MPAEITPEGKTQANPYEALGHVLDILGVSQSDLRRISPVWARDEQVRSAKATKYRREQSIIWEIIWEAEGTERFEMAVACGT